MTTRSTCHWAIVSTGRIAQSFAADLQYVEGAKLHAVVSRNLNSAQKFAQEFNSTMAYDHLESCLRDPLVDIVYIASPHSFHMEQASLALSHQKSVLCEKPIVQAPQELRKLKEAHSNSDQFLMEGLWTFFLPAFQKALQWVEDGKIGELRRIKVDFGYPQLPYSPDRREYKKEFGGGSMLELGIYPIALVNFLAQGKPPREIISMPRHAPNGVEDDFELLMDYKSFTASVGTSFRCKLQNWAYIIGEEGYIAIPDFWRANSCLRYELDTCVERFQDERESFGLCYEATAAQSSWKQGEKECSIMPLTFSLQVQELMQSVLKTF